MNDYSYTEIGMLAGTALGGLLAVIGFSATGNILYLLVSAVTIAAGIAAGNFLDGRMVRGKKSADKIEHQKKGKVEQYEE